MGLWASRVRHLITQRGGLRSLTRPIRLQKKRPASWKAAYTPVAAHPKQRERCVASLRLAAALLQLGGLGMVMQG
jgi:hypothetical protein